MVRRKKRDTEKTLEFVIKTLFAVPIGAAAVTKWALNAAPKSKHFDAQSLSDVDNMDGWSFEYYTAKLLRKNGFSNVIVTSGSGDFGVDITATKDKQKWAFQCKNYQSNLGVQPIQEVYSGAAKYGATKAVVVTNSYFTSHAQQFAKSLNVQLWDRPMLIKLMTKAMPQEEVSLENKECVASISTFTRNESEAQRKKVEQSLVSTINTIALQAKDATISINEHDDKQGGKDMATTLGAGKYIFGEDIPLGKYNLKALSGCGVLEFKKLTDGSWEDEWMNFGVEEHCAKTYYGLSLPKGKFFEVSGNVIFEITKAKMIEIE